MAKHTTPTKRPTKRPAASLTAASLTAAERDALLDLSDEMDALPDQSVKRRTYAMRGLLASARKLAGPLIAKSDLSEDSLDELERRVSVLERAELAWSTARTLRANPVLVAARAEGEAYKRQMMRTLRYFLRHDAEVHARLTLVSYGAGDGDLVDDLRKLAQLAARHASLLTKAKEELGDKPAEQARALAKRIESAGADRSFDANATDAMALRNRAFWHAEELEREVRDAGRYVYAGDPKRLSPFLREDRSSDAKDDSLDEPIGDGDGEGEASENEEIPSVPTKKPALPAKKPAKKPR